MRPAEPAAPITAAELPALFAGLQSAPVLTLAVSGGPDSTALLVLAVRWRKRLARGPKLVAVTIDHGLRAEARREAAAVKRLARKLGVTHRTLRWTGQKPATGLQARARAMRYALLTETTRKAGASHVLTAHTLDDQAETVVLRMARGSGPSGLAAMARVTPLGDLFLVRPLLDVPKARLIATLAAERISFADDPSNRDPRFTRARLRNLMPVLAREGCDARRLGVLARRIRRADSAIEAVVDVMAESLVPGIWPERGPVAVDLDGFRTMPAEVALRLLGRMIGAIGDEGPVELGKLEALFEALAAAITDSVPESSRFRRTLAGAIVTLTKRHLTVERAPERRQRQNALKPRSSKARKNSKQPFTKQR